MRWIITCIAVASLHTLPSSLAASDYGSLEELDSLWKRQRSEIRTASIRYRMFSRNADLAPLDPDQLMSLINSVDLVSNNDDMKKIIDGVASRPIVEHKPWSVWDALYLSCEVDKEDVSSEVSPALAAGKGGLGDFRHLPKGDVALFGVLQLLDDRARVRVGFNEMIVDINTGSVMHVAIRDGNTKRLVREVYHGAYRAYPDGVLFPSLTVIASYDSRGVLGSIKITLIENARFNIGFFSVTAEHLKYSPDKFNRPGTMASRLVIPNPVRHPNYATFRSSDAASPPEGMTSFRLLLIITIILSIAVCALLLVRRKRQSG